MTDRPLPQPAPEEPEKEESEELKETPSRLEFDALKKQADEYLQGWQRATADYQNLKRQSEKEKMEFLQFANAALLAEFFPLYDHLKRAWSHVPAEQRSVDWVKGFEHILGQFRAWLTRMGAEEIQTLDQQFDPTLHEAVAEEHNPKLPDQHILEEVGTGFRLNGKTILPAKVKVNVHAKTPS